MTDMHTSGYETTGTNTQPVDRPRPVYKDVMPRDLRVGDLIYIGWKNGKLHTIKVEEVEHFACSQRATHVNDRLCYSQYIPLTLVVL